MNVYRIVWRPAAWLALCLATPLHAEEFRPLSAGETELILSPWVIQGRDESRQEIHLAVEHGFSDSFQLGADWITFVRAHPDGAAPAQGIGDLELTARYSWMNIASSPVHAALDLALTIPVGRAKDELGDGRFALAPTVIVAIDLPRWAGAQAIVSFGSNVLDGPAHVERVPWLLTAGIFMPIDRFSATMDWSIAANGESFATPGVRWIPVEGYEFELSTQIGLTERSDRYRVVATFLRAFD